MLRYSITLSTKTNDPTAVSANPTKNHSKTNNSRRNEQSIPPIMKNERPNAKRNLLKRERYRPEHKAPKQKIEVAISDLHRNSTDEMGNKPAAAYMPRRSGSPQGLEGLESRG